MTEYRLIVDEEFDGVRLDKALSEMLDPGVSRSYIKKVIDDKAVYVDGKVKKASFTLSEESVITLSLPDASPCEVMPENIPLDILYEDDDVIVVNKPKGMVVHPAAGHLSGTLVNALMYHCGDSLSGINGVLRPGIVHRIDKDTSGSIIACKNDKAHMAIAAQLKEHSLNRTYRAVAFGRIDLLNEKHNAMKSGIASYDGDELIINAPIGRHPTDRKRMCVNAPNSKEAVTGISVIKPLDKLDMTYIECRLRTGRTHQIRVHTEAIGFPLLGDPVYNRGARAIPSVIKNIDTEGQALHAYKLGFIHPTKNEYIETVAPIPSYMEKITEIC